MSADEVVPVLLNPRERALIDLLGEAWNMLCKVVSDGPGREGDLNEAVAHIHALQHMVMAQAAARAFPHLYRPLGGWQ